MDEFDLRHDKWLGEMFKEQSKWIPANFRDFPLSSLVKTTSILESSNSFFGIYLNKCSNLVEFIMQFNSAIEGQRHAQDLMNNETARCAPELKTPLLIERHALKIYSLKIFLCVQADIVESCFKCRVTDIDTNDLTSTYKIVDDTNRIFNVVYNRQEDTYVCSCKKYIRMSILCSHIFVLFKMNKVDNIPDKYITTRWTKDPTRVHRFNFGSKATEKCVALEERNLRSNKLFSEFYGTMGLIYGDNDKMDTFIDMIREYRESLIDPKDQTQPVTTKRKLFGNYFQSDVPKNITIRPLVK